MHLRSMIALIVTALSAPTCTELDPMQPAPSSSSAVLAAGDTVAVWMTTGSKSALTYAPLPQDDPRQRQPDISRAGQLLGWRPTIELEEGLERTINYFKTMV